MRKPQRSEPRPSPLAQVQYTRPLSHLPEDHPPPEMGLVRDPQFWKRFSAAAHMAEDEEKNSAPSSATSVESKYGDHWLAQQHKEKRRTKYICASITLVVALVITAGAVCGWYFTHHKV